MGVSMVAGAWALCAGPAGAEAPADPSVAALEEVIVTAQRREEDLQRVAVAVDVVNAAQLADAGITGVADLNRLVPSLAVSQGGGANTSYFVRGVGNFTSNGISDPAVAFSYDNVYIGRATSTTGTFFDLERIEVLKGPQGTLYGRNATAGAINVIPAKPLLGRFAGEAALSAGSAGTLDLTGALNIPLGERVAARIAATSAQHDGYNDDGASDEDGQAARIQLLLQPRESLGIRFAADYARQRGTGPGAHLDGFYATIFGPPTASLPGIPTVNHTFVPSGLPIDAGLLSPASQAIFATYLIPGAFVFPAPLTAPHQDNDQWGFNAELSAQTPIGDLTLIPAYRKAQQSGNFNGPTFRAGQIDETADQTSIEVRLQGRRVGPVDWLVGAYYFDENVDALNGFNQYVVAAYLDYESTTRSTAGFARATAHVRDDLRLVLGGRYTQDDKSIDGRVSQVIQGCGAFPPPPPFTAPPTFCFGGDSQPVALQIGELIASGVIAPTPFTATGYGANPNSYLFWVVTPNQSKLSTGKTTYRIAVEWDAAEQSMIYASYETGYRSGGFNLAFGRESFNPESIKAFTLGAKNRFAGGRLQLNAEAFHWTYEDQQVSHFGADAGGNAAYFTENIGKSTIRGVDVEGQWRATADTLLSIGAQYLDSRIDRFTYRSLEQGGGNVTGCRQTRVADRDINPLQPGNELEYVVDCAGQGGYNSPEWSLDIGAEQTWRLGAQSIVLGVDTAYRSESMKGFDFLAEQLAEAYWSTNASLALESVAHRWSITAFVRNIEDARHKSTSQYNSATGGTVSSVYSAPRIYGVRATKSF
jgi:iron complex outermembrane receptor protein